MSNEIFHVRLNPRFCMLDTKGTLKLADFWTKNDNICDMSLFQEADLISDPIRETSIMRRDGWRYTLFFFNLQQVSFIEMTVNML